MRAGRRRSLPPRRPHGKRSEGQRKGVEPGIPDLLVLEPGPDGTHGLAVEFKIGGNKLSAEQRAWFKRGRAKRWRCAVVRSVDEFVALVASHTAPVIELD